jgi:hypothetical protein
MQARAKGMSVDAAIEAAEQRLARSEAQGGGVGGIS